MNNYAYSAIQAVNGGQMAFCKFISANETGDTGSHQVGFYIGKTAVPILFDTPGTRGENKDKFVKIRWQEDFETDSRFIYYGVGTRNEYRITRFGKNFPFLRSDCIGDLFVLIKNDSENYSAFILETEEEINEFLDAFALSPTDTGNLIEKNGLTLETKVDVEIDAFIHSLDVDFPVSSEMSKEARRIFHTVYDHKENIVLNPDNEIISWIDMEYRLFRKIEYSRYSSLINGGFQSVDQFVEVANMVLNRRKSRAGKSLEHHLAAMFDGNDLEYQAQPRTEGNKHPDFLFPSETAYHDFAFPADKLILLGAKTTCKDRWRQVINEADRIKDKHLFTLQQGISSTQLDEMSAEHITLVVPAPYITTYPAEKRGNIWTLRKFIAYVKEKSAM